MDIFTHAAAILVILFASGNAVLIPFGVLGAVIIDIDMAWFLIPRRNPSLYILHHAGCSHSFLGATVLSVISFVTTLALSSAGWLRGTIPGGILVPALVAMLSGAYLHLFLDWLAAPGLPLLYPLTEKRFGLAMTPMPLYFLITVLSLGILGVTLFPGLTMELAEVYGATFAGIILVSGGMKWLVHRKAPGRSYYTFHPFQWIVIREENPSYTVVVYDMFRGVIRELDFEKYRNIGAEEARRYDGPELRRHRYFSYISTVEKKGSEIIFHDPVREEGLISYPPWYPSVTVSTTAA
ncbi:MAG TPA: metal-dependent hydrolase [Methanomicrobiales archaeon]|nr:metal-dependent hydrolase [Methanomicrobiales archaeon]